MTNTITNYKDMVIIINYNMIIPIINNPYICLSIILLFIAINY